MDKKKFQASWKLREWYSNLKDHLNKMAAFESQTRVHIHCALYESSLHSLIKEVWLYLLLLWRDGAVVGVLASRQCGPGSNPGVDAIKWVEFVLIWLSPLLWEVFLRVLRSSPLLKNISTFWFDQESGRQRTTLWMCYLPLLFNTNSNSHHW